MAGSVLGRANAVLKVRDSAGAWPPGPTDLPTLPHMARLASPPQPALAALNRAPVQLWLPRISLSRCVRAVVSRSTLDIGGNWPAAWHENHFPASPLCSLGWTFAGHTELLAADQPPQRLPPVYFSGPFTRPTRSCNTPEGHGMILMLLPDAVQALTGLEPAAFVNRFVPAEEALGAPWQAMAKAVCEAPDDAARVALIEDFLEPRWQALRPDAGSPGRLRLQDWAQGLALRAAASGIGRSLRAAERRIKGWTGLPMRELRGLGRAEQAFFRALADGDGPVHWADVAADAGYADQSHLCRETRRVTGFAPVELRRRIAEDESFWIYRVWT
jgi:AraC-like DNA-binding protein